MGRFHEHEATIIGVVRGDIPLCALAGTDLAIPPCGTYPPSCAESEGRIRVAIQDIARGFVTYQAQPEQLRRWAWTLLSWNFIEIAGGACCRTHQSADGMALIALWDAIAGLPLGPEVERAIAQIVAGEGTVES
jgi:hypothetical protein